MGDSWPQLVPDQVARYYKASAEGMKNGHPEAEVRINTTAPALWDPRPTRNEVVYQSCRTLYSEDNEVLYEYAAIDSHSGSSISGKPTDWSRAIEQVANLTHTPVLVNEWGSSSVGAYKPELKWPTKRPPKDLNPVCEAQAWPNAWAGADNGDLQAAYIDVCLKIFADPPRVIGSLMYDWQDDLFCFCRRAHCPHECGGGLLDRHGSPKKLFFAFRDAVREYY